MKKRNVGWMIPFVVAIGMACMLLVPIRTAACQEEERGEKAEKEVKLFDLPDQVKAIVLREAGGNKIESIEMAAHEGVTVYEADWLEGDKDVEIKVVFACKLVGKKIELTEKEGDEKAEEQKGEEGEEEKGEEDEGEERETVVTFNQVPAPVKETIMREAGTNRIEDIEEAPGKEGKTYETGWFEKGWAVEIRVASDGKLLVKEMKIAEEEGGERCEKDHGRRGGDEEGGGEEKEAQEEGHEG